MNPVLVAGKKAVDGAESNSLWGAAVYLVGGSAGAVPPGKAVSGLGSTTLLTVTHVTPVAIVANTNCGQITVCEDYSVSGWPTVPYQVLRPGAGAMPNEYPLGWNYAFTAPFGQQFQAGQIVGYIQLPATGSTTFRQDENA